MSRVSNEQILTCLTDLPVAIAAAIGNQASPSVVKTPTDDETVGNDGTINVDKAYLDHVGTKLQARANADGNTYVLYARRNKANETKLAYCLGSKWTSLTDKRIIGAVKTIAPE